MEVKRASKQHLKTIRQLLYENELPSEGVEETIDNFLIIRDGSKIIGCAGLEVYGEAALLRSVAIRKGRQGQGLGKAITKEILTLAKRRKIEKLFLLTTSAVDFFKKLGFEIIERRKVHPKIQKSEEFSRLCPHSAVTMVKYLDD